MRCVMRKPRELLFKYFPTRLTKLNKNLPIFHGLSVYKQMPSKELNKKPLRHPEWMGKSGLSTGLGFLNEEL